MMRKFLVGVLAVVMGAGGVLVMGAGVKVAAVTANGAICNGSTITVEEKGALDPNCSTWCSKHGGTWSGDNDGKCLDSKGGVIYGEVGDFKAICSQDGIDAETKVLAGCNLTSEDRVEKVGQHVINIAIGVTAVLAVIAIILGGIQMALSTGDPGRANKAKMTIMFGAIAVVVATLAAVIVNFVITGLFGMVESGLPGWMDGFGGLEAWWGLIWGGGV